MNISKSKFVSIIALSAVLTAPVMASDVVSLQGGAPSSEDIIKGFTGNQAESGDIPGVKFRGIRMKKSAQPMAEDTNTCDVPSGAVALHIQFEINSFELSRNGQTTLDEMAKAMRSPELANCNFTVEGHTDASGKASYNQWLSEKRAQSVSQYLASHAVAPSRLNAVGKGEESPMNTRNLYAPENRRVQFLIVNGQ
jgi:outer membrane protein OmpA-like peptidoglycan-associated protein